ncbi:hypothetical protein PBY51_008242 [Eleginops maclovinus]|uniref:Uncharacterized protein n=1 Tax=Eleginops maclovinus TaxID=56733 RepID=A0AAN7X9S6_ELEMC|nr:hypothetical protein PBY51_008242 [Eleginops maclovinus]
MSDPRISSSVSGVGGIGGGGSGLGWGEWAGTGGVGSGGRRGQETPFWPCQDAEMLSRPKDELGAWCF